MHFNSYLFAFPCRALDGTSGVPVAEQDGFERNLTPSEAQSQILRQQYLRAIEDRKRSELARLLEERRADHEAEIMREQAITAENERKVSQIRLALEKRKYAEICNEEWNDN